MDFGALLNVANKLKEKVDKPKGWTEKPYNANIGGFLDSLQSMSKGLENKGLTAMINHNLVELRDKQVLKLLNSGKLTLTTYPVNPYDAEIEKYQKQGNNDKVLAMRRNRDTVELRDNQIKKFLKWK